MTVTRWRILPWHYESGFCSDFAAVRVLAGLLNFAPYAGPTLTLITLALVGLATSSQRKTGGRLVVFDALETDAALRTLASSFEYSYYQGGIHISEIVCGQAPVTRALTYSDLKDAFIAWMTMAIEARGACPARPRF